MILSFLPTIPIAIVVVTIKETMSITADLFVNLQLHKSRIDPQIKLNVFDNIKYIKFYLWVYS